MNSRTIDIIHSFFCVLVMTLLTGIFAACSNHSIEKQLSQAESLIVSSPDSAVAILANMDTTSMSEK